MQHKNEIFKWHPQERQPFENKCLILYMGQKLKSIFKTHEINFLSMCSIVLLSILYQTLNVNENYNVDLDKYIKYSVLNIFCFLLVGSLISTVLTFVKCLIG